MSVGLTNESMWLLFLEQLFSAYKDQMCQISILIWAFLKRVFLTQMCLF